MQLPAVKFENLMVHGRPARVAVSGPDDGLPVIFIHGFGNTPRYANRRTINALVRHLSAIGTPVRVIAPVLPGFSGTPSMPEPPSFEAYADWCSSCFDALGITGKRIVVGESTGGAI